MLRIITTILMLFFSINFCQAAQSDKIQTITIKSQWNGFGSPRQDKLIINNRNGRYRTNHDEIKAEQIDRLLAALYLTSSNESKLTSPDESTPTSPGELTLTTRFEVKLTGAGITDEWLNNNAALAYQEYIESQQLPANAKQEELFKRSFTDPKLINKVMAFLCGGGWTDDYPSIEAEILFADGHRLSFLSEQQGLFMVPWTIKEGENTRASYHAEISRALAQLLPEKFTNRTRLDLSDKQLRRSISGDLVTKVQSQWDRFSCEARISRYLDQLTDEFTFNEMSIGYLSSIDVEGNTSERIPSWNAKLQSKKLSNNFEIGVSLPLNKDELIGFSAFQHQIDQIIQRTETVPWLQSYLKDHPETKIEIRFVEGRSFSAVALKKFQENMIANGKKELIERLADQFAETIFLQIDDNGIFSRWLILPDQRMVLWQYKTDRILNWRASDFPSKERSGQNCSGAIVSPDGNILQR